jgi:hypothetical protein
MRGPFLRTREISVKFINHSKIVKQTVCAASSLAAVVL